MATRKSQDILKNEKYMDDVVSAAFLNLHRAAQKKSSHIWCESGFHYKKSIYWVDEISKPPRQTVKKDSAKNNSKVRGIIKYRSDSNSATKSLKDESDCEEGMNAERKIDWKIITENSDCRQDSPDENMSKSHRQSNDALRESFTYEEASSERLLKSVNRAVKTFNGDAVKTQSHTMSLGETETRSGCFENSRLRMRMAKVGKIAEIFSGDSVRNHSLPITDEARRPIRNTSPADYLSKENINCSVSYSNSGFENNFPNVNYEETLKDRSAMNTSLDGRMTLRSKRSRRDSESSSDSRAPLQKKQTGRFKHRKENSSDITMRLSTLLSVKIIEDVQWYEFITSSSDFNQIRKKYPQISQVLPDIDDQEKEIHCSFDAVKTVFKYLFNPPYNYNILPRGRIAAEVLATARSWGIQQFYDTFLSHILKNLTLENCKAIYLFAKYFTLKELCDACEDFASDSTLRPLLQGKLNERMIRPKKCTVLVYTFVEPLECYIPLENAEKEFEDCFDKDIRNTVAFEAVSGDFSIVGFGIFLDAESSNNGKSESAGLDISYTVKIMNGNHESEEIKQSKPFRSNIVIHFKKKIIVKMNQVMQISVETTLKPSLCLAAREDVLEIPNGETPEFRVILESNYKVGHSHRKRFFIRKLLYNPLDGVN